MKLIFGAAAIAEHLGVEDKNKIGRLLHTGKIPGAVRLGRQFALSPDLAAKELEKLSAKQSVE